MSNAQTIAAAVAVARSIALPEILGVRHLSELTGRSPKTIRRWLMRKLIPGRKVGMTWLVPKRALLEAIRDQTGPFGAVRRNEKEGADE